MNTGILGMGICLPENVVANDKIEKRFKKESGWIVKRTGIEERRFIDESEQVSDLGTRAALLAIKNAKITKEEIGLIIVATASSEMLWPSTACLIQNKLGLSSTGIPCFDVPVVCSSFVYGLSIADALTAKNPAQKTLFICAEAFTRFLDYFDEQTYPLFGDGAAAMVLGRVDKPYGIIDSFLGADGSKADLLYIPAGGSSCPWDWPDNHKVKMQGREVYLLAKELAPKTAEKVLELAQIKKEDVKYFVLHQANQKITDSFEKSLGLHHEQVPSNIAKYGNTSSATIPILLYELYQNGKLDEGDIVVTVGFGAGFTWGANVIRWNLKRNS